MNKKTILVISLIALMTITSFAADMAGYEEKNNITTIPFEHLWIYIISVIFLNLALITIISTVSIPETYRR